MVCDSWGFVAGPKDVGLQKYQGAEVLDEPGLIVQKKFCGSTNFGLYNA